MIFWAFAALVGKEVVGITGFNLPLTRLERRELFIYDLAVKVDRQRKGIGPRPLRLVATGRGG